MPSTRQKLRPARRIPLFSKRGPLYGSPLAGTPWGRLLNELRDVAHKLKLWPLLPGEGMSPPPTTRKRVRKPTS